MTNTLRSIGTEFEQVGYSSPYSTEPFHFILYTYRIVSHDEVSLSLSPTAPIVLCETVQCIHTRDLTMDDSLVVAWLNIHHELDAFLFLRPD